MQYLNPNIHLFRLLLYKYKGKEYKILNNGIDIKLDNFDDVTIDKEINDDIITFFESFKKHNIIIKYLNINKNIKISNFILDCINIKDPINIMDNIDLLTQTVFFIV